MNDSMKLCIGHWYESIYVTLENPKQAIMPHDCPNNSERHPNSHDFLLHVIKKVIVEQIAEI